VHTQKGWVNSINSFEFMCKPMETKREFYFVR